MVNTFQSGYDGLLTEGGSHALEGNVDHVVSCRVYRVSPSAMAPTFASCVVGLVLAHVRPINGLLAMPKRGPMACRIKAVGPAAVPGRPRRRSKPTCRPCASPTRRGAGVKSTTIYAPTASRGCRVPVLSPLFSVGRVCCPPTRRRPRPPGGGLKPTRPTCYGRWTSKVRCGCPAECVTP